MYALSMDNIAPSTIENHALYGSPESSLTQKLRSMAGFAADAFNYGYADAVQEYRARARNLTEVRQPAESSVVAAYDTDDAALYFVGRKEIKQINESPKSSLAQKLKNMAGFAADAFNYGYADAVQEYRERVQKLTAKERAAETQINSNPDAPACNLYFHNVRAQLISLMFLGKTRPDKVSSAVKETAGRIAEEVASAIKTRSEITRVLLDLGRHNLSSSPEMLEAAGDIRRKILQALRSEFAGMGLLDNGKGVAILGESVGEGNVGKLYSLTVDDTSREEAVVKAHHVNNSGNGRQCLIGDYPPQLIRATEKNRNLIRIFGTLYAKVLQGGTERPRRFDILEKVNGSMGLWEYLNAHSMNFRRYKSPEFQSDFRKFLESIFIPVLNAVKALHNEKLIHRDLKPDNILIIPRSDEFGDCDVKMNDYDLVCRAGEKIRIWGGSPCYASPEWQDLDHINCSSDIYSLGMFLYEFFGGRMPETMEETGCAALDNENGMAAIKAPYEIRKIVSRCLQRDPKKRPDIDELINAVQNMAGSQKSHQGSKQSEARLMAS